MPSLETSILTELPQVPDPEVPNPSSTPDCDQETASLETAIPAELPQAPNPSSTPESAKEMPSLEAAIPAELLAEILLRLPTPADLVRAAAACVPFHRLATDRTFLRRFRRLHAPPLLGFVDRRGLFFPALPPHPSARAALAVAAAADFHFTFLPGPARWEVQDVSDGRVLLDRSCSSEWDGYPVFLDLAVCDPLHRRYLLLPPIADGLKASVKDPLFHKSGHYCETFLLPPTEEEDAEETSFRVVWMTQCRTKIVAFVFSSSTGEWAPAASKRWTDLFAGCGYCWVSSDPTRDTFVPSGERILTCRQYAYGRFYWGLGERKRFVVLDTQGMEFSLVDFPITPGWAGGENLATVEAGEGRLGLLGFPHNSKQNLFYIVEQKNGESSSQWLAEENVELDRSYLHIFIGTMEGYFFLYQCGRSSSQCLALDIKTMQLETVSASDFGMYMPEIYTNFPPSLLSSPTV